jgi:bla regulator protein BlaR1
MTQIIDGVMLLLSSSLAASILSKATLIATLGLMGAWLTRRSPAAVRHAVLAASLAVLLALPIASTLIKPVRIALPASTQEWAPLSLFPAPMDAAQAAASADGSVGVASATPRWRGLSPSAILLAVWIAGAAFFLLRMIFGLQQVRALRRFGQPWRDGQSIVNQLALDAGIHRRVEVLLHESLPAPVTCGIVRPAIMLPPDTQEWEGEDLNRAFVHELEHVRRFDWASHVLARIACAVYWFHPLVWVAWRQLALEAERSCDDAVLARSEATAYAAQLVRLARRLLIAQPPALAMANRSDLSARVGSMLDGRRARGRASALQVAVACAIAMAIVLTMSPLRVVAAPHSSTPGAVQNIPKWDAVSIKRCTNAPVTPVERRGAGAGISPDRLTLNCMPLSTLINQAYSIFAGGQSKLPPYPVAIEHLPSWADSERYTIEAKSDGNPGLGIMRGPMLQALLEDRFALKIHPETREGRAYLMTVAKGGPKLPAFQGGCTPMDLLHVPAAGMSTIQNVCGVSSQSKGANVTLDIPGMDLDSFARAIARGGGFDGPVLNKTGLTGYFHFHLEFLSNSKPGDPGFTATDDLPFPSIFTAMQQQLGLKVEAGQGPREFLVVDHLEKPSEN